MSVTPLVIDADGHVVEDERRILGHEPVDEAAEVVGHGGDDAPFVLDDVAVGIDHEPGDAHASSLEPEATSRAHR